MSPLDAANTLSIVCCPSGHAFFYHRERCPVCDSRLETCLAKPAAVLVTQTTVRVNPTGRPFRIGLAQIAEGKGKGARTLCLLDAGVDGDVNEPVLIYREGDVYRAAPHED